MSARYGQRMLAAGLFAMLLFVGSTNAGASSFTVRSGGAPPTALDPIVTYLVEPSGNCAVPFATAFTAADFAAADAGPAAWSLPNYSAWVANLWCDPAANWVSTGTNYPSRSTLYSVPFNVPLPDPCCIEHATIDFCWAADDVLGDSGFGGPNPLGLYLNGVGLPIAGGSYATATRIIVDITGLLRCGDNRLYVYDRDLGCAVSGAMFSATINYTECTTPTRPTTWGAIRALYR